MYQFLFLSLSWLAFTSQAFALDKAAICSSKQPVQALFEEYKSVDIFHKIQDLHLFMRENPMENGEVLLNNMRHMVKDGLFAADAKTKVISIVNKLGAKKSVVIRAVVTAYLKKFQEGLTEIQYETTESENPERFKIREERINELKKKLITDYSKVLSIAFKTAPLIDEDKSFLNKWIFEVFLESRGINLTTSYLEMRSYLRESFQRWGVLYSSGAVSDGVYLVQNNVISFHPGLMFKFFFRPPPSKQGQAALGEDLNLDVLISPFVSSETPLKNTISLCDFKKEGEMNSCQQVTFNEWCAQ